MSKFIPNEVFLRGLFLDYFDMNNCAAENHRILVEVYGEHALAGLSGEKLTSVEYVKIGSIHIFLQRMKSFFDGVEKWKNSGKRWHYFQSCNFYFNESLPFQ